MSDEQELAATIVSDLIALRTVNPMGCAHRQAVPVERPAIEYLEQLFSTYDVDLQRDACGDLHESLLIAIPGRTDGLGTLFEAHLDTVPADDWRDRAFLPRREGARVIGRGACDDKGSVAAIVLALLPLLKSGKKPPQTVWFLAAGDEEYGQTGIKSFIRQFTLPIGRGVFGEPTDCLPVVQHKGTIRWDITVHGRSAHTSQPELGRNAILEAMRVIEFLLEYQTDLQFRFKGGLTSGSTITVTTIHGGRTRNVVPDECVLAVDFRTAPAMNRQAAVDDLFTALQTLGVSLSHSDFQCFAPALNTSPDDIFVQRVLERCTDTLQRPIQPAGVPYGSDAGWIPDGVPAIVLGPGNIAHAHAIDEFVDLDQIIACARIYQDIMETDWQSASQTVSDSQPPPTSRSRTTSPS